MREVRVLVVVKPTSYVGPAVVYNNETQYAVPKA